jgi:hypothetical protein
MLKTSNINSSSSSLKIFVGKNSHLVRKPYKEKKSTASSWSSHCSTIILHSSISRHIFLIKVQVLKCFIKFLGHRRCTELLHPHAPSPSPAPTSTISGPRRYRRSSMILPAVRLNANSEDMADTGTVITSLPKIERTGCVILCSCHQFNMLKSSSYRLTVYHYCWYFATSRIKFASAWIPL